jgi:septum formation protein
VRMLELLSGRRHEVLTGVCLRGPDEFHRSGVTTTGVVFAPMTSVEIASYVATGEPMDKAGAYAVQGLASRFITRIEGSYPNVVGLPVEVVYAWCREAGIRVS